VPPRAHNDFSAGVVSDVGRHLLPEKAVYSATDMFLQEDSSLVKRGGFLTALSANSAIRPADIAILDSSEQDNLLTGIIYDDLTGGGGTPINLQAFTPSPSAITPSAQVALAIAGGLQEGAGWSTGAGGGRPARYFNRILRPNGIPSAIAAAHQYRAYSMWGGAPLTKTAARTGVAVINVVTGDPVLTGFAAGDITAVEVGMMLRISNATNQYVGRIIGFPSATTIAVSPTPTSPNWNTGGVGWVIAPSIVPLRRTAASPIIGANCLTVWGDRVILGGVAYDALNAGTKLQVNANRLAWGILPAVDSGLVGTVLFDGMREGSTDTLLATDFDDVMGMETIFGLEPVNQGELLVLGYPRLHRVVGYFSTQTTQAGGGNTWDVRPVQDAVSCVSDRATASTPIGIFFAGPDGIYLYRGGRAQNVMEGRIRRQFRDQLAAGATVTGGGYLGSNTYAVFLTGGTGYMCNFDHDSFRWLPMSMSMLGGRIAPDPTRPPAAYIPSIAAVGAADTTRLQRVESIFSPAAANKTDPGGASPNGALVTRAYTEGDPAQLKLFKSIEVVYRLRSAAGGATCQVSVTGGIDAEETPTVLAVLTSNTSGANQFRRYVFTPRVQSRALTVSFALAGTRADEFEIVSLKIDSVPLNEKRT
jgi:hypothetical protein